MDQKTHPLIYILRFLIAGIYVVVCLLLLALLISAIVGKNPDTSTSWSDISMGDSSNAVANGLSAALYGTDTAANTIRAGFFDSTHSVASGFAHIGTGITDGSTFVAVGIYHGVLATGRGIGHGVWFVGRTLGTASLFVLHIPVAIVGSVVESQPVSAVIRPADHEAVPVINPNSPELAKAKAAMAAATPAQPAPPITIWPIHGMITTEFGVPEPPYEPIHTGIDISDGKPAGVTPVKAFRIGRVIDVEHTGGLGNHVVVDHGNGVTSVYGHMSSIVVSVGQEVDTTTTLGYEGSTGVSTGPHVHFEIRVNGQATNPHQFIPGLPY